MRMRGLILALLLSTCPALASAQRAGTMATGGGGDPTCAYRCTTAVNSDGEIKGYGCYTSTPYSGGSDCAANTYMCILVITGCWGTVATQDGEIVKDEGSCTRLAAVASSSRHQPPGEGVDPSTFRGGL